MAKIFLWLYKILPPPPQVQKILYESLNKTLLGERANYAIIVNNNNETNTNSQQPCHLPKLHSGQWYDYIETHQHQLNYSASSLKSGLRLL